MLQFPWTIVCYRSPQSGAFQSRCARELKSRNDRPKSASDEPDQSVSQGKSLTHPRVRNRMCSRGTNTTTDGREWKSLSDRKATRKTAQKSIKIIFNYGPIKWKRLSTFILIHFLLSLSLGCVCCVWILFLTSCEILWLDSEFTRRNISSSRQRSSRRLPWGDATTTVRTQMDGLQHDSLNFSA